MKNVSKSNAGLFYLLMLIKQPVCDILIFGHLLCIFWVKGSGLMVLGFHRTSESFGKPQEISHITIDSDSFDISLAWSFLKSYPDDSNILPGLRL